MVTLNFSSRSSTCSSFLITAPIWDEISELFFNDSFSTMRVNWFTTAGVSNSFWLVFAVVSALSDDDDDESVTFESFLSDLLMDVRFGFEWEFFLSVSSLKSSLNSSLNFIRINFF